MNQNSKGTRRSHKGLRLWTHTKAKAALSYVIPVLRSLREHWLDMRTQRQRARRLAERSGRPGRATLLEQQAVQQRIHEASAAYVETLKELQALEITAIDPARGQALFPFLQKKKLAWFLFDLFDEQPLTFWRYQDDPVDVRRPIARNEEDAPVI